MRQIFRVEHVGFLLRAVILTTLYAGPALADKVRILDDPVEAGQRA